MIFLFSLILSSLLFGISIFSCSVKHIGSLRVELSVHATRLLELDGKLGTNALEIEEEVK